MPGKASNVGCCNFKKNRYNLPNPFKNRKKEKKKKIKLFCKLDQIR